jgi:diacylglycerol kinase family enzyme
VRALLIVNPHATSTTRLRRDVIARALASAVELEIVETRYRGHGTSLAADAAAAGYGLVITLGGDGTVNEAVNGLLGPPPRDAVSPARSGPLPPALARPPALAGPAAPAARPPARAVPALAPLPGGSANVFARALGLAADPVDAAGQVISALAARRFRTIGLGLADDRYFTFNSGLGLDAEVVRAVEGRRAHGRSVSPALYMRMAGRQFWRLTDRRTPAMHLAPAGPGCDASAGPGHEAGPLTGPGAGPGAGTGPGAALGHALAAGPLFWCTVSNTAPWTYVGRRPVQTNPEASFDAGLDVFGLRSLGTVRTLATLRQMLSRRRPGPPRGRGIVTAHNLAAVTLTADRPVAFQIDGEYVGEREHVCFRAIPDALRVVM